MLLFFSKKNVKSEYYTDKKIVIKELLENEKIIESLKENVEYKNTILDLLFKLEDYDKDSNSYKAIYDKVISVGEYDNE